MFCDVFITAFLTLLVYCLGALTPLHNWDMIGYVASAFHLDGYYDLDLLRRTYEDVRSEVSEKTFLTLTTNNYYRETVYQDFHSLSQQIPFYLPRYIFIQLMRLLVDFNISYSQSSYLISAFFSSASVSLAALICKKLRVSLYFLPFVIVFSGLINLARLSSPDGMACFFSLLVLYLLLSRDKFFIWIIAAFLPLIRTDFILLSFLLVCYSFISRNTLLGLVSGVIAIYFYGAVNSASGNYGWLTIINFTLIETNPYPAQMDISYYWLDYVKPFVLVIWNAANHVHGLVYFISFTFWFFSKNNLYPRDEVVDNVLIISACYVLLHIILFPAYMDRFFTSFVIYFLIYIFSKIRRNQRFGM